MTGIERRPQHDYEAFSRKHRNSTRPRTAGSRTPLKAENARMMRRRRRAENRAYRTGRADW
ncbi:hypothetical protein Q8791_23665 [Nocardiopsis sp. CT-R113]|uniref:Uncharacterized protein n=1 Tax=Nocardiopsis codii TaxID=3065942 RepID=A0ABU7KDA6_9ACTN|nr:hypothetical protein [Nocardiopsis sp. CT-R113]MEE2040218.1 hypothetical protein [Nocardiopsis sp. CT-R113]